MLDEDALPAALVADWQADEANAGKPFPSYARQLARRGTLDADSRWSWTVDFAARRAEAREAMQPLLDGAAQLKSEVVDLKEQLKRRKKEKAAVDVVAALEAPRSAIRTRRPEIWRRRPPSSMRRFLI